MSQTRMPLRSSSRYRGIYAGRPTLLLRKSDAASGGSVAALPSDGKYTWRLWAERGAFRLLPGVGRSSVAAAPGIVGFNLWCLMLVRHPPRYFCLVSVEAV